MADTKVSALTAAIPIRTDVAYLVDDPGGTPLSKKATVASILGLTTEADIVDLQSYLLNINSEAITELSDVSAKSGTGTTVILSTITTIASNEILKWSGTNWINNTLAEAGIAAASHTHVEADITDLQSYLLNITGEALSTLSDVTITSIASGELLKWNGSAWINNTLAEAGIAASSHTHVAADITDLTTIATDVIFNAADDLIVGSGSNTSVRLPIGTEAQVLKVVGGVIAWATDATGAGAVATDVIWDTAGDIAVASGSDAAAALPIGSEGEVLSVSGGVVAWAAAGAADNLGNHTATTSLKMAGFDIENGGVIFLTEQAAAEVPVAGKGQWWVKTATPNVPMFTDDAGTDFQLASLAGTEILTGKTINTASNTITVVEADISDLQSYLLDITGEALSTLSDVTITSIASGELLKWNGSAWINNTLAEAGVAAASHTHATSDITSGALVLERGGTEIDASAVTNGQLLIGNSTGNVFALATITGTANEITVTNGASSITLSIPTSPTFVTPTIASFTNAQHNHQAAAGGGTLDHGLALIGLTDDDHTQYALLLGRSGGQTLIGGTGSGDDLTLTSTSNATKGSIFSVDEHEFQKNAHFGGIVTYTPAGTTQTVNLADHNHFILDLESASGAVTLTLTQSAVAQGGWFVVRQDSASALDLSFAVGTGVTAIKWKNTEPNWSLMTLNDEIIVSYAADGTNIYLTATSETISQVT